MKTKSSHCDQSVSIEKAAEFLGLSVSELQQLAESGKIKSHRTVFSGHYRFYLEDLKLQTNRRTQKI